MAIENKSACGLCSTLKLISEEDRVDNGDWKKRIPINIYFEATAGDEIWYPGYGRETILEPGDMIVCHACCQI